MYKKLKISMLSILISGIISIASFAQQSNFANNFVLDPYNPEYVKNEILVKFKDDVDLDAKLKSGKLKTGQDWFDKWLEKVDAEEMTKVFPNRKKLKSAKIFRDWKGQMREAPKLYNIYRINFKSDMDPKELAEDLSKEENIEYAEPNYFVYTQEILESSTTNSLIYQSANLSNSTPSIKSGTVDDPLYVDGSQWYIDEIHAPEAWELATGEGQLIAIIDTGIEWDHPDLDDNIWENPNEIPDNGQDDDGNGYIDDIRGWDWINNDNNPDDDNSHGTHVAGIAAAESNASGIVGVAYNSKVIPLKVMQSSGRGNTYDLINGIEYAISQEVDVINMSLGTYAESLSLKDVIIDSYADKIFTVAAAGNDELPLIEEGFPAGFMYPACWPFVMGVQARAEFSNHDPSGPVEFWNSKGNNYEFYAPGINIISTIPGGLYRKYNGTSMACPQVAAACALFKEYWDFGEYMDHVWAKLIFGSDNYINIKKSLKLNLDSIGPQLKFIDFTLVDTLPGCDRDGRADAGETIEIWATLRNCGGLADSVWGKIDFGEFEDTSVAEIQDSSNFFGNISTWAWMDSELEPIRIKIDSSVAHNRDIVFSYSYGDNSGNMAGSTQYIINVENAEELRGVLTDTLYLTSNKLWLVNDSYKISPSGYLHIENGTFLELKKTIINEGKIHFEGTKNNPISVFLRNNTDGFKGSISTGELLAESTKFFGYCSTLFSAQNLYLETCIFQFDYLKTLVWNTVGVSYLPTSSIFHNCVFQFSLTLQPWLFQSEYTELIEFTSCVFSEINTLRYINGYGNYQMNNCLISNSGALRPANVNRTVGINNCSFLFPINKIAYYANKGYTQENPYHFWGTIKSSNIDNILWDFFDDPELCEVLYKPIRSNPSNLVHGHVWKVEIDSINPFDEFLEPLGSGRYKFDVYFNRPMDIEYSPTVGFGVTDPWLQRIITEDAQWSADSTVWTAFYTFGQETGDGINTIHVRDAQDTEGFEIPPEYSRFKFKVQAAAAASIEFFAIAGIGKVELEWPASETEDALGYDMYRYYNLTDSTFSDPILINETLIIDTIYTDFDVIPDTTYHYQYKTVGTDLQETDFSKSMAATPFTAANGDSNGDLSVNILDLTTVVSYILGYDPKPFLVDAADVNYDSQINVLDIVGIVDLILGTKSELSELNTDPAYIYMSDSLIQLNSDNQVAALQFELIGEDLENIKLFSLIEGFEFSYGIVNGKLLGIMYNLSGISIPAGLQDIIRIENATKAFDLGDVFGSDKLGRYIEVRKGSMTSLYDPELSENEIIAYPNPFNTSVSISYQIEELSYVNIDIYNLLGQKVSTLISDIQGAGQYKTIWNGSDIVNGPIPVGNYVCKVIIKPFSDKESFTKEIKLINAN